MSVDWQHADHLRFTPTADISMMLDCRP